MFSLILNQMDEQQLNEKCYKEQARIEEQKDWLGKEEKKTSEWIEVLVNSSVEMLFKTDSDLLRTSVEPLEPNGSRSIFPQTEERMKEFVEEIATMVNVIVE